MTQVFIQERSHVNRGFHALEEGNNVDTTLLLKSFQGVLGDVLILYRIAVLPYLLFRAVYLKGATRATAVDSGWR